MARLTHLRVPTIVRHGTPDRLVLVDNGRRLAGLINTSRHAELPAGRSLLRLWNTDEVEAIGDEGAP
jgi:pimeloyl-ACP methyl ester carboxylesterase